MKVATGLGNLNVEERGAGAETIVMWPSLYCDSRSLEELARRLARDHRVLVIDGPGHGKSDAPARPFSPDDCADALVAVLDARGIAAATLFGSAWGGMIGVVVAARHPTRVKRLVIANAPLDEWRGFQRLQMWSATLLIRLFGPARVAPLIFGTMLKSKERMEEAMAAMKEASRPALAEAARSVMLRRPSLLPILPGLRVPTLVFSGSDDAIYPLSRAQAEAERIPGARFVAVPDSAHASAFEEPAFIERELRAFLDAKAAA
jgi:3-oxoadipate enol-lactonase